MTWGGPGDTRVPAAYRIHVNARTVAILLALQEGFKVDIRGKTELKVPLGSSVPLRTLIEPPMCSPSALRPPLFTQPPHAPLIAPIFHLESLYFPIVPLSPHISPNCSINCPPYCPSFFPYHPRILTATPYCPPGSYCPSCCPKAPLPLLLLPLLPFI